MFLVLSRALDKEKILSPHEELKLGPSDSILQFQLSSRASEHTSDNHQITMVISQQSNLRLSDSLLRFQLSGRASQCGIQRSEVQFLIGTQNFLFCPMLVTRQKTSFFIIQLIVYKIALGFKFNSCFLISHMISHYTTNFLDILQMFLVF